MSLVGFRAANHPQQTAKRGAVEAVDDRSTPAELLEECRELAGVVSFDLDVAATERSAKAPAFYTPENSGLEQPWYGHVWCNPPYSDVKTWVAKASREADACLSITMLLPANRTEQAFWHEYIEGPRRRGRLDVFFLKGRRRFDPPRVTPKGDRPPFGLCVVVFKDRAARSTT